MAEAFPDSESRERAKAKLRFMELFHGRFDPEQAELILQSHNWDAKQAVNFVLESSPQEISQFLQEDARDEEWQQVRPRNKRQRREEALLNENLRRLAAENNIPAEVRQFACEPCDKVWWRNVPARKMVFRCFRCRRRYAALPRELEWGWAKFVCRCNNTFFGFGAMGRTLCLCYRCNQPVWPHSIIPPKEQAAQRRLGQKGPGGMRRRDPHSCLAENCYNQTFVHHLVVDANQLQGLICVHPKSLDRQVVEESENHRSTGSTVDTFLTQDDLDTHDPLGAYVPREPSIAEEDGDDQN